MTLIVDGMNVIGSVPNGWWRDRTGAMRRLVAQLEALDGEVVLVLDGRERDLGLHPSVQVRWAPVADDLIAVLAGPGDVVVTSDRGLAERVRAGGGQVTGARDFRRQIDG
ncbi:MAG: hypothetical protein QOI80_2699 [Solirubrobacteraceae bacterium]|nr:hypothetical protein [Solirubrobacteraceae bacterium]